MKGNQPVALKKFKFEGTENPRKENFDNWSRSHQGTKTSIGRINRCRQMENGRQIFAKYLALKLEIEKKAILHKLY